MNGWIEGMKEWKNGKQYWCENLFEKMLMNKVEIELKCYQNWLNILTSNIHFSLLWLLSSQQHQKYSFYTNTHKNILSYYVQGQHQWKYCWWKIIWTTRSFFRSLSFDTQHKLQDHLNRLEMVIFRFSIQLF